MSRSLSTGLWALTDASSQRLEAPEDIIWTHIEWNTAGLDLVVLDCFGRPYVFNMAYALGRMQQQPVVDPTSADDLSAVVGLHWFPIYPVHYRSPTVAPAMRNETDWTFSLSMQTHNWPRHPHDGKAAFFTVSRDNYLRLYFQQDDRPWMHSMIELGDVADSGDLLSHAAFTNGAESFRLATYDSSRRLRLYSIHIRWDMELSDDRPANQPARIESVQLAVEHLDVLEHCMPQYQAPTSDLVPSLAVAQARLSKLCIMPSSDLTRSDSNAFDIFALYTTADIQPNIQSLSTNCSVVARWTITEQTSNLHASFSNLKPAAKNPTVADSTTALERYSDVIIPKTILDIVQTNFDSVLAFPASDGSIDFRTRDNLELLMSDGDDAKASGLAQSGFAYLSTCLLYTSPSPRDRTRSRMPSSA